MNVLVLGARLIGSELAFELAHSFVGARFLSEEARFVRRYKKVLAIEAKYMCGDGSGQSCLIRERYAQAYLTQTAKCGVRRSADAAF